MSEQPPGEKYHTQTLEERKKEANARYRNPEDVRSRENVEDAVKDRYSEQSLKYRAEYLFDLPEGAELSEDEARDVQLFSVYAGKRLVHAESFAPILGANLAEKPDVWAQLQDHDLTHAMVAYGKTEGTPDSKILQVLQVDSHESYTTPAAIQEEITANLWGKSGVFDETAFRMVTNSQSREELLGKFERALASASDEPGSLDTAWVMERTKKDIPALDGANFESTLSAYEVIMREILRASAIAESVKNGEDSSRFLDVNGPFEQAFRRVQENPDPFFVEVARNIFEKQAGDPKVLLHEFQRVCGPLLERLRTKGVTVEAERVKKSQDLSAAQALSDEIKRRF